MVISDNLGAGGSLRKQIKSLYDPSDDVTTSHEKNMIERRKVRRMECFLDGKIQV